MKINVKNFFPQIPSEEFEGFKGGVMEVSELGYLEMEEYLKKIKEIKGDKWKEYSYQVISQKQANNLAKFIEKSVEKTACGFAMLKQDEDYLAFETYQEMFGPKIGAKKFQEHIEGKRRQFKELEEKFPKLREVVQKY